ncbi:NADPH:quinone reductase [Actinoplanes sp. OR16]|uniref:NAD(P)-dependent alcohol dehydrogenase n=1 Tax=Actinoplanes sp. OR16 TaxID=946334 RepID=UPI000F6F4DD8|nr:NAD(P)-dependent alcohol dehydrogenase [Actinoplanes sp. OR16]BBH71798.1 NADPH:quinone reductase [Actinoplanes sp. OR16]
MKALTQKRYGGPETLDFTDVARPAATGDRVLVRVRAASVNAYDWHVMRGDPRAARLTFGLRGPKAAIRGRDFAGTVEAVGPDVTLFQVGDEVFGDTVHAGGTLAEYVAVPQDRMAIRPPAITAEQAAAMPLAGVTASQGMRSLRPGQKALIIGGSGGVGTFAVQMGKSKEAEVTAVCSTRNVDLLRSLGVDHVIDYRKEEVGGRYDLVFDLVGSHSLGGLRRLVAPGGTLVLSGGGVYRGGSLVGPMRLIIQAQLASRFVAERIEILSAVTDHASLTALAALVAGGTVKPVIDRTFPLPAAADAIRYLETEHARAKVVITV